ncbi:MAG TPA: hypothetical protein ENH99_01560 [Candidatus Pacearchaeota archaeon]|nr:hypothetical protein [Candidatus Pacearchaeota archaeon]
MKKEKKKDKEKNLTPGNYKHGFYYDGLLPCKQCPEFNSCQRCEEFADHRGKQRCIEEKEFFDQTMHEIKDNFELDGKDIFQLPQMVMNMIKLKRINRYMAEKGPHQTTILFNPKTGKEHEMDTSNVLSRDSFYAQKALLAFLDSLRLSRSSRDAKDGVDVLAKMMQAKVGGK